MKKNNMTESREKALKIAGLALEKKAVNPMILEVGNFTNVCDYFVIASGEANVHVRAIYDEAASRAKELGMEVCYRQIDEESTWAVVDFFDVILHVFTPEARSFYNLEELWPKAKNIKITSARGRRKKTV